VKTTNERITGIKISPSGICDNHEKTVLVKTQ